MSIKSIVTDNFTHDLFGVLVRVLISNVKVMSSNPDESDYCIGRQLCIV
jgi:hypothetical protein